MTACRIHERQGNLVIALSYTVASAKKYLGKELANIKTEFVEIQILSTEKILGATVAVDQNLSSSVTSRISGRIEKLYFKATGETIKKGQPVYEIYSGQLIACRKGIFNCIAA